MSDDNQRPPFLRKVLGNKLRALRKAAEVSPATVATEVGISVATLSKIETGKQAVKPAYVKLMCPLYGVDPDEQRKLVRMAEDSGKPGQLSRYSTILRGDFVDYHEMERQAETILAHEPSLIFGPFQVPAYVRALRLAAKPDSSEDDLARSVELRQHRLDDLTGSRSPAVSVVLDEAALMREVGGTDVMRDQFAQLIELAKLPNIDLHIVPLHAGAYAAQGAEFVLLRVPPEPMQELVFLENDMIASYLDRPHEITRYKTIFEQAKLLARDPAESAPLLDRLRTNL